MRLDLDADLHKLLRMAAAADKSMAAYARDVLDRHLRGDKKLTLPRGHDEELRLSLDAYERGPALPQRPDLD